MVGENANRSELNMLINVPMWECTDVPIREASAEAETAINVLNIRRGGCLGIDF